ncbi:hypothetical protein [Furfurilactobacillus entadae]|uniref:hypothetical protein n=1 Tax=Furfurilactobacillus entadae TaxID=2922307 RepID=UPI0035E522E4
MEYNLGYTVTAVDQLMALPKKEAVILISWLKKNAGFNPLAHGHTIEQIEAPAQAIKFNLGQYTMIAHVTYNQVIILAVIKY